MQRALCILLGAWLLCAATCNNTDQAPSQSTASASRQQQPQVQAPPPVGAPPRAASKVAQVAAQTAPAAKPALVASSAGCVEEASLPGGNLFDGSLSRGAADASCAPLSASGAKPFVHHFAQLAPRLIDSGNVPRPDNTKTNPLGAQIAALTQYASGPLHGCYHAVGKVLRRLGVMNDSVPYRSRACQFPSAYAHNAANVQSRFKKVPDRDVMASYPFLRGSVIVWADRCSHSAAMWDNGHIEIVRKSICHDSDPHRCILEDRHYKTQQRTYDDLASFANRRNQEGTACLQVFEPRNPNTQSLNAAGRV